PLTVPRCSSAIRQPPLFTLTPRSCSLPEAPMDQTVLAACYRPIWKATFRRRPALPVLLRIFRPVNSVSLPTNLEFLIFMPTSPFRPIQHLPSGPVAHWLSPRSIQFQFRTVAT